MTDTTIPIRDGKQLIDLKEKEVAFLRLCCQDIPYSIIARRMGKSPRTIDGYRDDLFLKLRVRSRTGLVLWCFKAGLLQIKDIRLGGPLKRKSSNKKRRTLK